MITVFVKTRPEANIHEQSTRIIFKGGAAETVEIVVMFVASATFVPLIGMSRISTAIGKFAPTSSSTGGIDCRSHFAARVCSMRWMASEFAARL